jgi:hypothetical protein
VEFGQAPGGFCAENAKECLAQFRGNAMTTTSVTTKQLLRLRRDLTDRDWQIMATLARVRVATGDQLERLHFADVTRRRAKQRLSVLARRRVVGRMSRVVGGVRAGSRGHVYALDAAGQRLVSLSYGGRPRRPWPVGTPYLAHALAISEVYVQLVLAERTGALRLGRFVGEPGAWRTFYGVGGARATLKPDAYVVLQLGGYEDHWFLEVDRGTESAATLARKAKVYREYWRTGTEQVHNNGLFPRVLWLVPDEARAEVLRAVFRRQPADIAEIFDVVVQGKELAWLLRGAGL